MLLLENSAELIPASEEINAMIRANTDKNFGAENDIIQLASSYRFSLGHERAFMGMAQCERDIL